MRMRFGYRAAIKVALAVAIGLGNQAVVLGVSITINNDVATGAIADGSTILVDGWVYDAREMDFSEEFPREVATYANKVKIYLFYQQTRPSQGVQGSARVQLDASFGDLPGNQSNDSAYSGEVTANMPDQAATAISPRCWFLRCEAILDTPQAPNSLVANVEKDVNLVWPEPRGS